MSVLRWHFYSGLLFCYFVRAASIDEPKIDLIVVPFRCLRSFDPEKTSETSKASQDVQWELVCPLKDFLVELKDEESSLTDNLRLLVGRALHNEVLRVRNRIFQEFIEKPRQEWMFESNLFYVFQDFLLNSNKAAPVPAFESTEGLVLSQTEELLKEAAKVLEPLMTLHRPLESEAIQTLVKVNGDSLRFAAARELIESHWARIPSLEARRALVADISGWVDIYGALPLRAWLEGRLRAWRPTEITGSLQARDLESWVRSLELEGAPPTDKSKLELLVRLRQLWIAFPTPEAATRLRHLAVVLGVSAEFQAPGLKSLTPAELLTRARAHLQVVNHSEALRTMKRFMALSKEEVDPDLCWDALRTHVRILRVSDRRHLIPPVLDFYLKQGSFLIPPKQNSKKAAPPGLDEFLNRGIEITRMAWSYDTREKAEELLARYLALSRAHRKDSQVGQLLYLRARMVEQQGDLARSRDAFRDALEFKLPADLQTDLIWRNFHVNFELTRSGVNPLSSLRELFPSLERTIQDSSDKSRLAYWKAQTAVLGEATNKTETVQANQAFEESYRAEPYSFYSNLSGLELSSRGHPPSDWLFSSEKRFREPRWKDYLDRDGQPKKESFVVLARVYGLAQLGDFRGAQLAAREFDKLIWDHILSAKSPISKSQRPAYARAVAWLRWAIGDSMGSLRTAEVARQAFALELETEDFLYLYPLPYWKQLEQEAHSRSVNPWLAASLIRQESAFNPRARSWANALGLMQMIPAVAKAEAKSLGMEDFTVERLYDPAIALRLGVYHLANRLDEMQGSWIGATAAYNAGSPPVHKWVDAYPSTLPVAFIERISFAETRNYVRAILRNFINYRRLYSDGKIELGELLKMPLRGDSQGKKSSENVDGDSI